MTTVAQQARAEQAAHFAEHKDMTSEEVIRLTAEVYDGIDAMTSDQRHLLVRDSLSKLRSLLIQAFNQAEPATAIIGTSLTAVASYAIEVEREQGSNSSTGDAKVNEVLDNLKAMLAASAVAQMSPEDRATAEEVEANVRTRTEAGESYNEVVADELRSHGLTGVAQASTETSDEEDDPLKGLYL